MNLYIFDMVMDVIVVGVKDQVTWSVLFADNVVLVTPIRKKQTGNGVVEKCVGGENLKIGRVKTEFMWMNGGDLGGSINFRGGRRKKSYIHLGLCVTDCGGMEEEVNHRIQSAWCNLRKTPGVLCDKRLNVKLKGKMYKSIVRPELMYSYETWAIKNAQERWMEVADLRMLRWMCRVARRDRIRNDFIRGTVKVTELSKLQQRRLRWFGPVMRGEGRILYVKEP
ncbi:uncharacterized protein LOC135212839 [Macrobrachium nipponense]|uniref:uncharacterized protein LOC135212839 n=1 Tax=Macrobrachium nipponense TaxID=159736 RepID=UPI0030C7F000